MRYSAWCGVLKGCFSKIVYTILTFVFLPALSGSLDAQAKKPFQFTKVDLALLQQTVLLDEKFEDEGLVFHDNAFDEYLTQIGRSMLPEGETPERVQWQFRVLRDPMANAFALPNGTIYVNTGLLTLLENEGQLASVIAHEITHVTERHSYLRHRDYRKKALAINLISYAGGMAPGGYGWGVAIQVAGMVIPSIIAATIEGYARNLEEAADIFALNRLAAAGYDPGEIINAFKLLETSHEVELQTIFYNDHPKLEQRIAYVSSRLSGPDLKPGTSRASASSTQHYLTLTERTFREDIKLSILSNRARTALATAEKLVALDPESSEYVRLLADTYTAIGPRSPRPTDHELSERGRKDLANMRKRFTMEEEAGELMSRPEGQAAWEENKAKALSFYQKALELDPSNAEAYRGLGFLHERSQDNTLALDGFRRYLEMRPDAPDKKRIQLRIERLEKPVLNKP